MPALRSIIIIIKYAGVPELADGRGLGSRVERRADSSSVTRTIKVRMTGDLE